MNIYLIRHGDAEKASPGKKDFDRELTASGKSKLKNAAEGWKNIIEKFDFIVSSPLTRAVQTARVIADVFGFKDEIIADKKIAPGSKTESIVEIANALGGDDIAFVGHQPDFGEHLAGLVTSGIIYIEFKKGAIAGISFDGKARLHKGTLEYLIPAGIFK